MEELKFKKENIFEEIESDYKDAIEQLKNAEMTKGQLMQQLSNTSEEVLRLQGAVYALDKLRKPTAVPVTRENK